VAPTALEITARLPPCSRAQRRSRRAGCKSGLQKAQPASNRETREDARGVLPPVSLHQLAEHIAEVSGHGQIAPLDQLLARGQILFLAGVSARGYSEAWSLSGWAHSNETAAEDTDARIKI
jgi:hypothetical protein